MKAVVAVLNGYPVSDAPLRDRPMAGPADAAVLSEHGALLRQWGGLQRHMDTVLRAAAAREAALAGENLRLRAELVLLRTSVFWGLGTGRLQCPPGRGR